MQYTVIAGKLPQAGLKMQCNPKTLAIYLGLSLLPYPPYNLVVMTDISSDFEEGMGWTLLHL